MVDWGGGAAPARIGVSWRPTTAGAKAISAPYQGIGWEVPAAVVETIDELRVPMLEVLRAGRWMFEVYPVASVEPGAQTTTVYLPNSVDITTSTDPTTSTSPGWQNQAGSTVAANVFGAVDETVLGRTDYITPYVPLNGVPAYADIGFGFASAAWAAAQRVVDVRVHLICDCQQDSAAVRLYSVVNGSLPSGEIVTVGTTEQEVVFSLGEINPATGLPWTEANVEAFDSGSWLGIEARWTTTGVLFRVYQMWIEVDWIPETRIVVAAETLAAAATPGWQTFDAPVHPTSGVANWSKTAQTYLLVLRNLGYTSTAFDGAATFPWLSSGEALPTGWRQAWIPVDGDGTISADFDDYEVVASVPLVLSISAAGVGDSADGQPFAANTATVAYTGNDVEQEITTGGAGGVYGRLRFLWGDKTSTSTNGLTVRVKRRSDNVQFGSAESFSLAQLRAGTAVGTMVDSTGATITVRLIERDLTSTATLAVTTQYYVEFSATATAATGHEIMLLRATTPAGGAAPTGAGASTFAGTTDQATYVSAEVSTSDVPVTLSTIPTAPANFAAALATETLETEPEQTACPVTAIDRVNLSWNATSLGASFGYYEIQRDNGDALSWQTIAQVTTEAVVAWAGDLESIRGSVDYRIRVVRSTDDEVSVWSATATVTRQGVPADPTNPVWIFTSNLYPSLTCAYDASPSVGYRQIDGPRQKIINRYGVDGAVRVVETERRLEAFDLTLTVSARGDLTPALTQPSRRVFDPILALCSQTSAPGVAKTVLPYVAVIDPWGSSWLAAISVDLASVALDEGADEHTAILHVEQLTETPYVIDLSV